MKITLHDQNQTSVYTCEKPVLLSDVIKQRSIAYPMPCGGSGKCGKCLVIAQGHLSAITEQEKKLLGEKSLRQFRLACLTQATGDCEITIPVSEEIHSVSGFAVSCAKNPVTDSKSCYAGVVDIGTTTVAAYLYQMPEGRLVDSAVHKNAQSAFGADVISRLTYAAQNGASTLSLLIRRQITEIFSSFGVQPDFTVITGNTAMLHFYENLDCSSLAKAPFSPASYFGFQRDSLLIPRCISAFVGADITCGILASGMLEHEKAMLIDIGTNGEIVYKNGGDFSCCSASAGPAFEGASIQNGSPSVAGAINKVYALGNRLEYTTIGREKPKSICGSGLVDAVASMLRCGVLDRTGYLEQDYVIGDSGIAITPSDIRQVQTAKAAVKAAIETLCEDLAGVEAFYIAGGFGQYLNIENAVAIGLLPKEVKKKTVLCGNTAAAGAAMMLFDKNSFSAANEIARQTKTVQLASNDVFYQKYISFMNF